MSPCHNLEPSLVARDSSRLLSVKPNEWMHLSPLYTRMHGEWLRYAKSTSQFHCRFLLVRDVRGFQVNPLCRHDITSPFPPSGNGGYIRNLDGKLIFGPTPFSTVMNLVATHYNCTLPMDYISHHALHSHIPIHHYNNHTAVTIHSLALIVSPHLHLIHTHTFKQHSHMHSPRSLVLAPADISERFPCFLFPWTAYIL